MKLVQLENLKQLVDYLKKTFTATKATNAYNDEDGKNIKKYYRLQGMQEHMGNED